MSREREEAVAVIRLISNGSDEKIDRRAVDAWMSSSDIQALGAVYYMLFDGRFHPRIEPPFTLDDYLDFTLPYYERCFRENPDTDWASTRYTAGWDLAGWFVKMWRDPSVPRSVFKRIKAWLETLYRTSNDEVRNALVTATLEHIFEDKRIATFFADWQDDPLLAKAWTDAASWSAAGGKSPLGRTKRD